MQFLRFYSFWQVHALFTCILYALIIIIIIIIIILFLFLSADENSNIDIGSI